jgi:hypothetical protein
MAASWVMEEMRTVDLKDKRLNARLQEVLCQLASQPRASIPAACGGHAEMAAAYRLFDNEKATFDRILEPHAESTRQRIANEAVVLLVQDTTEVDLTRPERQVAGAGPLDGGPRRGGFLHPLHAFTPDGTPLGTLHAARWARDEREKGKGSLPRSKRVAIPIEAKESQRWVTALRWTLEESKGFPSTRLVCVADSEGDIYELLAEGMADPREVDWIVRACQNRALERKKGESAEATHVREHVLRQPVLFTRRIRVRGRKAQVSCCTGRRRQPRESREAEVEVRVAKVTLRAPWRPDRKLPEVVVHTVLVREVAPPAGEVPVEWLLLTSLPIDDIEQVERVIQYYRVRWMIEVFFHVLKSGCRVEERRFEEIDRLWSCLAVYLIVAWRTLYVCHLGRECPEVCCEVVFEPWEWKPVWTVVRRTPPPRTPPTLGDMVRYIAQLGGYVNRRSSASPGPQTLWIGIQRMHDFATCWQTFGPDARKER